MARILCFGDSNTWGSDPQTGARLAAETRWPGVLAHRLGEPHTIIEEGLPGRTTVFDDPIDDLLPGDRNGKRYLVPCMQSHKPFDLIIIMLGTNDLKTRFSVTAADVAEGAEMLVTLALGSECGPGGGAPAVLLVCPPPISPAGDFAEKFQGAEAKSHRFAKEFARVAAAAGCPLVDLGLHVAPSSVDGLHFDAAGHATIGAVIAEGVSRILDG